MNFINKIRNRTNNIEEVKMDENEASRRLGFSEEQILILNEMRRMNEEVSPMTSPGSIDLKYNNELIIQKDIEALQSKINLILGSNPKFLSQLNRNLISTLFFTKSILDLSNISMDDPNFILGRLIKVGRSCIIYKGFINRLPVVHKVLKTGANQKSFDRELSCLRKLKLTIGVPLIINYDNSNKCFSTLDVDLIPYKNDNPKLLTMTLENIHRAGVVHRDLKLDNIMMTPTGLITIIDFGESSFSSEVKPDDLFYDPNEIMDLLTDRVITPEIDNQIAIRRGVNLISAVSDDDESRKEVVAHYYRYFLSCVKIQYIDIIKFIELLRDRNWYFMDSDEIPRCDKSISMLSIE